MLIIMGKKIFTILRCLFFVYLNLCSTYQIHVYTQMRLINAYADIFRYACGLNTDLILHLHTYIMRSAKILSRLRICIDLPKPSLIASLKISCTGMAIVRLPLPERDDRKTWRTCEHPERGRGAGGLGTRSQIYRVPCKYWFGTPGKSQSYQAIIQCWAIISPPVCLLWLFTSHSKAMVI